MKKEFTCSICMRKVNEEPNNSQPINDGECCEECNNKYVVPTRMDKAFFSIPYVTVEWKLSLDICDENKAVSKQLKDAILEHIAESIKRGEDEGVFEHAIY